LPGWCRVVKRRAKANPIRPRLTIDGVEITSMMRYQRGLSGHQAWGIREQDAADDTRDADYVPSHCLLDPLLWLHFPQPIAEKEVLQADCPNAYPNP